LASVLIIGASRGLGLEFARQYAADGWRVFATCRDPDSAEALRSLKVSIHPLEVTDRAAIEGLARTLADEKVDVMIANAGVMTSVPSARPADIAEAAWLEAFRVNTIAPLMCATAFVKHVAASEQRKMLVMSSWIGSITSNTAGGHYVYRASKSALNAVWRSFAIDHPEIIAAALSPRRAAHRYDALRQQPLAAAARAGRTHLEAARHHRPAHAGGQRRILSLQRRAAALVGRGQSPGSDPDFGSVLV
jgi:NAD(P)-dependent dehydrogenase (short-subunit alcohol dehydrogenase family)